VEVVVGASLVELCTCRYTTGVTQRYQSRPPRCDTGASRQRSGWPSQRRCRVQLVKNSKLLRRRSSGPCSGDVVEPSERASEERTHVFVIISVRTPQYRTSLSLLFLLSVLSRAAAGRPKFTVAVAGASLCRFLPPPKSRLGCFCTNLYIVCRAL